MTTPVNSEIAKLLKEKGLDKPTKQRYFIAENVDSDKFPFLQEECALHNWNDYDDSSTTYYSAPTIAEVVMWLYEKHDFWINVFSKSFYKNNDSNDILKLKFSFIVDSWAISMKENIFFNSPIEAYEAAIEYCLNNLIK